MRLNLLPQLNRNNGYKMRNLIKPINYSVNNQRNIELQKKKIIDSFKENNNLKNNSLKKNKNLYINKTGKKNKNFNLTQTDEFDMNSRSIFSGSLTKSYKFFQNDSKKKNIKIITPKNKSIKNMKYISINNNSKRDSSIEKIFRLNSNHSLRSSFSSNKFFYPLKTEYNENKSKKSLIINQAATLSNFLNKGHYNLLNSHDKKNNSKKYIIISSSKRRNGDKKNIENLNKISIRLSKYNNSESKKVISEKDIKRLNKLSVTSNKFFDKSKNDKKIFKIENKININPINNLQNFTHSKIYKKKKNKLLEDILKNETFHKILKNPDLKALYNMNKNKIIKMINSQSKANKLRLSLIDYQNNLIQNCPKLKTENFIYTLNRGFQNICNQDKNAHYESLIDYISFIQDKELDVINQSNNFNQKLYFKFLELGFSPKKYNFKPEKIEYKDVLINYK